jgi:hypothetical protein
MDFSGVQANVASVLGPCTCYTLGTFAQEQRRLALEDG